MEGNWVFVLLCRGIGYQSELIAVFVFWVLECVRTSSIEQLG
jgi:hypothetical protein